MSNNALVDDLNSQKNKCFQRKLHPHIFLDDDRCEPQSSFPVFISESIDSMFVDVVDCSCLCVVPWRQISNAPTGPPPGSEGPSLGECSQPRPQAMSIRPCLCGGAAWLETTFTGPFSCLEVQLEGPLKESVWGGMEGGVSGLWVSGFRGFGGLRLWVSGFSGFWGCGGCGFLVFLGFLAFSRLVGVVGFQGLGFGLKRWGAKNQEHFC